MRSLASTSREVRNSTCVILKFVWDIYIYVCFKCTHSIVNPLYRVFVQRSVATLAALLGSMCSDKPNVLIRAFSYRGASTQCTAVQSSLGQVMLEHAVQRQ